MNHDSAPAEIDRSAGAGLAFFLKRLRRRFQRWKHFREWQYGNCNGCKARRNRLTGEVQFVMWPKGHVTEGSYGAYDYTYPADWWINFNPVWWPDFEAAP